MPLRIHVSTLFREAPLKWQGILQLLRRTHLTPESHHRINTHYASIDKVLSELKPRFSENDLGNICNSETPDKESFSRIAKFYNIDGKILEAEQKIYASFYRVRGLGYMTVSEMLGGNARE